jgi:parallel beta-helix repeat protein
MQAKLFARTLLLFGIIVVSVIIPRPPFIARGNPSTLHVPQDYATIQAAVNAASSGDTIIVAPSPSGTYSGNITISKSLFLMGTSTKLVIINASNIGPGLIINSTSKVSVSQLTIQDPDSFSNGISILSSLDVTITSVIVKSTVPSTGSNGTWIYNSNNVVLRNNTITGNLYGVAVQGGFSNTIQANNLTRNYAADVFLAAAAGNQVKNNYLTRSQTGIDIWYGSTGNLVANNPAIANNSLAGIYVSGSGSNQIIANDVDFNNSTSTSTGVYLSNTSGNSFYYNNIRHNSIQVFGVGSSDLTANTWNDGAANKRGNFWSFYPGVDNGTGGRPAGDGVGDTYLPWPCPRGGRPCSVTGPAGVDYYPLMLPVKPPTLNVTAAAVPLSGCALPSPLQVNFTSSATGGALPYTYSWRFGDGNTGTTQNATHSYSARGALHATITVNDTSLPSNSATDFVNILSFPGGLSLSVIDDGRNLVAGTNVTSLSQPPGQTRLRTTTNSTGGALFPCLPPGPYKLQLSKPGFQTLVTTITVANTTSVQILTLIRIPNSFPVALLEYLGLGIALAIILVVGSSVWRRSKRRKAIAGTGPMPTGS